MYESMLPCCSIRSAQYVAAVFMNHWCIVCEVRFLTQPARAQQSTGCLIYLGDDIGMAQSSDVVRVTDWRSLPNAEIFGAIYEFPQPIVSW